MKQAEKQNLIDALNYVYSISTKAQVEKQVHDTCFNAAKELMKVVEGLEVEQEDKQLEKVD
jgi:hypothetical protein